MWSVISFLLQLAIVLVAVCALKRLPLPRSVLSSRALVAGGAEHAAAVMEWMPPEVGWDIWAGSIIAVLPIIYAAVLFYERIETQRACLVCSGIGLVYKTKQGSELTRPRKCYNCGGLLPWLGWNYFFFTTFFDVGNGGVVQNVSKDYDENNAEVSRQRAASQETDEE